MRLSFSSRLIKRIKYDGRVFINGRLAKLNDRAEEGDLISVGYPEELSYFKPEEIPVEVLYEDSDFLAINKQSGLVVHPTRNFQNGTLANALSWRMKERREVYKLRFVNRLDMNTSGLMIVAKNSHCQHFLMREMAAGRFDRMYLAIVHGIVDVPGTVDAPIGKETDHAARRIVRPDGYPSLTHYEPTESFAPSYADLDGFEGTAYSRGPKELQRACEPIPGYTLLRIRLGSGRTHQIRVHMSYMGTPILGDELYGEIFGYGKVAPEMPRQALHSSKLEFTHPVSRKRLCIDAPLPKDMEDWLERTRLICQRKP